MKQSLENWQEAATRSLDKMYQRAVKAETEAQELRDTLEGWDGQVAALEERAEAAEAKLAGAQKDRDGLFEQRTRLRQENKSLRASMDRARDALLSLEFAKAVEEGDLVGTRRVVHRLLSGDEPCGACNGAGCAVCNPAPLSGDEKRPNPAHPDWFPPDGTGKAE